MTRRPHLGKRLAESVGVHVERAGCWAHGLLPHQERYIEAAFAPGVQRAALSMGRGGGKTALCGAVVAEVLRPDGELFAPGREVAVVAPSARQGALALDSAHEVLGYGPDFKASNVAGRPALTHTASKARAIAASRSPSSLHGLRARLYICDEPAQWISLGDQMHAAVTSALVKYSDARMVAIGTAPAQAEHWYAKLLREKRRAVAWYRAGDDADPLDEHAWLAGNPGLLRDLPPRSAVAKAARRAARDPAELAIFRALVLNCGTPDVEDMDLLVPAALWRDALSDELPPAGSEYVLGIDLGGEVAMSAAAAYWPDAGRLEAFAAVGDVPPLDERARQMGAPEGLLHRAIASGELVICDVAPTWTGADGIAHESHGRRTVDVEWLISRAVDRWGTPRAAVADQYRIGELEASLKARKIPAVERRIGFLSAGQDIRAFTTAVADRDVIASRSAELLTLSMSKARTTSDHSGNRKMIKAKRRAIPDDIAQAAVLAVAEGLRKPTPPGTAELFWL